MPTQLEGDAFGFIYEDFLSNFAAQEGKGSGEYFTPYSIVRLIVEILQPFQGRVFDPACGSGGMFVQCAKFIERHHDSASRKLSVFGTEKTEDTVPLTKMNLALHGLSGDIRQANSYYEDPHNAVGAFDYVMANLPFNVDKIKKDQLIGDKRFPFALPKADNGNFLWIQQFYSALSSKGRADFVMANSAGDAGHSEKEIRKQLIESGTVEVMVAISSNFFYTVTLPVTLWFLDKSKAGTAREDTVLFLDARHIFRQIDRATATSRRNKIEFLANVVRLYRGEEVEISAGSEEMLEEYFPDGKYVDVGGLCKVATRAEIEAQGWTSPVAGCGHGRCLLSAVLAHAAGFRAAANCCCFIGSRGEVSSSGIGNQSGYGPSASSWSLRVASEVSRMSAISSRSWASYPGRPTFSKGLLGRTKA